MVPGLLSETHETLFFSSILKRIIFKKKRIKSLTYSLDLSLSRDHTVPRTDDIQ